MNHTSIDMTRPTALYLGAAAALLLATFILGRLPVPSVSQLLNLPYPRAIAGGAICLSIAMGLLGAQRLAARARAPWRVPQSQSLIAFIAFFVFGAVGLVLSV